MAREEIMETLDLDNVGEQDNSTDFVIEDEQPKGKKEKPAPESVEMNFDNDEDSDDVELEVVDDTPTQDRGRKPLPDDVKKQLEEEDVEEYSTKVQQRIDQMKKAWHDERREKERALRERDEAARVAQMAYQERTKYQQALSQGEVWMLEQAKQRANLQLEAAKRNYREAYDMGDSDKIVEAQHALNVATLEFDRVSQYRPQYTLQPQQNQVYNNQQPAPQAAQQQQAPRLDPKLDAWTKENSWFGSDDEMTSFALGVHQKLVKEGVSPQTDEYFERINARMKEVFPEKFGVKKKRQPSTVVAPVGRSPKGKKVVLTQTQVALARKLGITPEQYAKELVKQQTGA